MAMDDACNVGAAGEDDTGSEEDTGVSEDVGEADDDPAAGERTTFVCSIVATDVALLDTATGLDAVEPATDDWVAHPATTTTHSRAGPRTAARRRHPENVCVTSRTPASRCGSRTSIDPA